MEDRKHTPSHKLVNSTMQDIQVLVTIDPWQILIPMKGTRVKENQIASTLDRSRNEQSPYNSGQFASLLHENKLYAIQTNFEEDELDESPIKPVLLNSKKETSSGWEFIFQTTS